VRALLSTLHTVLWENSGWQPLGMTDLVEPNRVKRSYMKVPPPPHTHNPVPHHHHHHREALLGVTGLLTVSSAKRFLCPDPVQPAAFSEELGAMEHFRGLLL